MDWLKILKTSDIDIDTDTVNGFPVTVEQCPFTHSDEIEQTLIVFVDNMKLRFIRRGLKVISYDRWVDTNWFEWEEENAA